MERSEQESLRQIADGDLVELEIFCRRHTTKMCNFAYRLLWNWADAEEAAQETLFRVFKLALDGQFDEEPGTFMATMYRIARNLCMDRMSERGSGTGDEKGPVGGRLSATERENLPGEPERGERAREVDDALAKLSPNHRAALLLKDYGGLRYAEIARVLDCSMNQVKMLVCHARRQMADVVRDGE